MLATNESRLDPRTRPDGTKNVPFEARCVDFDIEDSPGVVCLLIVDR